VNTPAKFEVSLEGPTRNGGNLPYESDDGKFVYFGKAVARGYAQGLWRIPVDGGEETLVLAQP
jgi:hypothetical protein